MSAKQIAEIVIQHPTFVKQLGLELAARVEKSIHEDTDKFWGALELVQKAGLSCEAALLEIERAIERKVAEMEE